MAQRLQTEKSTTKKQQQVSPQSKTRVMAKSIRLRSASFVSTGEHLEGC